MTVEHIEKSIESALTGTSGINSEILNVRGFSTQTIRHLFHSLCNTEEPINYLEIGLFCGASFVSSFNKNCTSIGIEDHSQDFSAGFEQVKKELKHNIDDFSHFAKKIQVHYIDCFKMDKSLLPKIDIYSYDGHHDEIFQEKALPSFLDCMADRFLFLIDDWTWYTAKNGTLKSFKELGSKIEIEKEWIFGDGGHNHQIWHNGVALFLINKK